jgi:hypothetical protein
MHRFDLDAAQAVSLLVQLSKEQHNSLEAVARLLLAGDQRPLTSAGPDVFVPCLPV